MSKSLKRVLAGIAAAAMLQLSMAVPVNSAISLLDNSVYAAEGDDAGTDDAGTADTDDDGGIMPLADPAPAGISIDKTFPDAVFAVYVATNIGKETPGYLTEDEVKAVKELNVAEKGIADLTGMEIFTNLETLNCSGNDLTILNLSANTKLKNLNCSDNKIKVLDISKNTALKTLDCSDNEISYLNIDANPDISKLIAKNNKLACFSFDSDVNEFDEDEDFDFSGNVCTVNSCGGVIDFKDLPAGFDWSRAKQTSSTSYVVVDDTYNKIAFIGGSDKVLTYTYYCGNGTSRKATFSIKYNPVSHRYAEDDEKHVLCTACGEVRLIASAFEDSDFRDWLKKNYSIKNDEDNTVVPATKIFNNLRSISLSSGSIASLKGIEYFPYLESLYCYNNALESLDVSKNIYLKSLSVANNNIKYLDLSKNVNLTSLTAYNNDLAYIDLTNNTKLSSSNVSLYGNGRSLGTTCGAYSLSNFEGIDASKITPTSNCELDALNNRLINLRGTSCKYTYNCGNDIKMTVEHSYTAGDHTFGEDNVCVNCQAIQINETTFPDDIFRAEVKDHFDQNSDGALSQYEIDNAKSLSYNVYYYYYDDEYAADEERIQNLKGIEYLTKLESLDLSGNKLEKVDFSKNLALNSIEVDGNQLTTIDVSMLPNLTHLNCQKNVLTTLDVSKNTALKKLYCDRNALTALDVSANTALEFLNCTNNKLTALDLGSNTVLKELYCEYNQLTTLDVSANTALEVLDCEENMIYCKKITENGVEKFDLTNNKALRTLDCSDNCLAAVDLSSLEKLSSYYVGSQKLYIGDICGPLDPGNLLGFDPAKMTGGNYVNYDEDYKKLFFSFDYRVDDDYRAYYYYDCGKEASMSVYVYFGKGTHEFGDDGTCVKCGDSPAIEINAANFPDENFRSYVKNYINTDKDTATLSSSEILAVTYIDVEYYGIKSLEGIQLFKNLKSLDCRHNQIITVDLSKNKKLESLLCGYNKLNALDLSANTALVYLSCENTRLTALDLSNNTALTELYCSNPDDYYYNDEISQVAIESLDLSKNTALVYLDCSGGSVKNITLPEEPALMSLNCSNNGISNLDFSKLTKLETLVCSGNELTALDLSTNIPLSYLDCSKNKLTSLDLSLNRNLLTLKCSDNLLSSLNLAANKSLHTLDCTNNKLAYLDLTENLLMYYDDEDYYEYYLKCKNNVYDAGVVGETLDLSSIPGFDVSKASDWDGAVCTDGVLSTFTNGGLITYTYDMGNDHSATFSIQCLSEYATTTTTTTAAPTTVTSIITTSESIPVTTDPAATEASATMPVATGSVATTATSIVTDVVLAVGDDGTIGTSIVTSIVIITEPTVATTTNVAVNDPATSATVPVATVPVSGTTATVIATDIQLIIGDDGTIGTSIVTFISVVTEPTTTVATTTQAPATTAAPQPTTEPAPTTAATEATVPVTEATTPATETTTAPVTEATTPATETTAPATDLPQTGNNVPDSLIFAVSAMAMTFAGAFVMLKSGVIRRKKNDC